MPSRPLLFTHLAMVFAVPTALTPEDVGVSVAPNAEAMILMPALWYSFFFDVFWDDESAAQLAAWSTAPLRVRKESATTL